MSERLLPIVPDCECIVIRSTRSPQNVGKQVKAERLAENGDISPDGKIYKTETFPSWFVTGEIVNSYGGVGYAYYDEKSLIRIDGFKETEQEKARELTT